MVNLLSSRLLVDAVINKLEAAGFAIGDGVAPDSPSPSTPYAVVYSLPALERDGPWNDRQADEFSQIQITYVGEYREQAQGLADTLRTQLLEGSLNVPGRSVQLIDLLEGSGVERDDDPQPPLYYTVDTFAIWSTPQ